MTLLHRAQRSGIRIRKLFLIFCQKFEGKPKISLKDGLKQTIDWYVKTHKPTGKISETKLLEHNSK